MGEGGPYWLDQGELTRVRLIDYTGDGTNDRVIPLGVVCDEVKIIRTDVRNPAVDHLATAYATRDTYAVYYEDGAAGAVAHAGGGLADAMWQGFNPARDSVILGSAGGNSKGTNQNAVTYRIVAKKYRSMA